jgi:hydroxypyruvate reductase
MTVMVRGDGIGGRNTEMAAAAAIEIDGIDGVAIASLATDGDDGVSEATGGVVVGDSASRVRDAGLDPAELLAENDTRAFLDASGGLIVTGQTGINVNDLYLALIP